MRAREAGAPRTARRVESVGRWSSREPVSRITLLAGAKLPRARGCGLWRMELSRTPSSARQLRRARGLLCVRCTCVRVNCTARCLAHARVWQCANGREAVSVGRRTSRGRRVSDPFPARGAGVLAAKGSVSKRCTAHPAATDVRVCRRNSYRIEPFLGGLAR